MLHCMRCQMSACLAIWSWWPMYDAVDVRETKRIKTIKICSSPGKFTVRFSRKVQGNGTQNENVLYELFRSSWISFTSVCVHFAWCRGLCHHHLRFAVHSKCSNIVRGWRMHRIAHKTLFYWRVHRAIFRSIDSLFTHVNHAHIAFMLPTRSSAVVSPSTPDAKHSRRKRS